MDKLSKFTMKNIAAVILFFIVTSVTFCEAANDSALLPLTKDILTLIKEGDYEKLAEHFHPVSGVRFSPYGYIDTTSDRIMTVKQFNEYSLSKHQFNWGSYDGTGDEIKLNTRDYFKRFVYDVDFLNAEKTSLNTFIAMGNSPENIAAIYEGLPYTESYFSGFDEKFGGMDWRALKLVYKKHDGKYYLVGIIHSEWTI